MSGQQRPKFLSRTSILFSFRTEQFWHPRNVHRDLARFIVRKHPGVYRLCLVCSRVDLGERLPICVADNIAGSYRRARAEESGGMSRSYRSSSLRSDFGRGCPTITNAFPMYREGTSAQFEEKSSLLDDAAANASRCLRSVPVSRAMQTGSPCQTMECSST